MNAYKCLFALMLGTQLLACAPAGDSLLGDRRGDPTSLVVDIEPKQEELMLSPNSSSYVLNNTETKVEISGSCFISTYPNHQITVTKGGVRVPVLDSFNPGMQATASSYAQCKNGKFSLTLASVAGNSDYVLMIQAMDSANATYLNEGSGVTTVRVSKAN